MGLRGVFSSLTDMLPRDGYDDDVQCGKEGLNEEERLPDRVQPVVVYTTVHQKFLRGTNHLIHEVRRRLENDPDDLPRQFRLTARLSALSSKSHHRVAREDKRRKGEEGEVQGHRLGEHPLRVPLRAKRRRVPLPIGVAARRRVDPLSEHARAREFPHRSVGRLGIVRHAHRARAADLKDLGAFNELRRRRGSQVDE